MLTNLKKQYGEATTAIDTANQTRRDIAVAMYRAVLDEKGITDEQPVKITLNDGTEMTGEFRIHTSTDKADIRFYPYRKDGELGKNPRVFDFGWLPDIRWTTAIATVERL